jgi:2'-5' RNA ligase
MREFVIVYMVGPAAIGTRFTMWPLHLTLMPWFEAPYEQIVEQKLSEKLEDLSPFDVSVGEPASFGAHKRLPVSLVEHTPEIQNLHETLLEVLRENNWQLQGRYTGAAFKPHVTQKAGQDASRILHIDELYIIEAQPQNYRQVMGKVDLA